MHPKLMGNDKPKEREVGTVAGLLPSPSERGWG